MWVEEFSEVGGGCTMQTLMGVKEDFEFDAEVNGEPVQSAKDGSDVLMFTHSHQDPGSAVLGHIGALIGAYD